MNYLCNKVIFMKKTIVLALIALAACQSNSQEEKAEQAGLKSELIEFELGQNVVYGVMVKDFSEVADQKGYSVKLTLNEKVWFDTLYLDLSANQEVQGEVIFSEAIVDDMGGAKFEVNTFQLH
tara:strand:+ start:33746 stop:34114 length:369 start_codon:yes stop_codon:yes gene_type:complete